MTTRQAGVRVFFRAIGGLSGHVGRQLVRRSRARLDQPRFSSTGTATARPRVSSRRRRIAIAGAIVLALFGAKTVAERRARTEVERIETSLRASGEPVAVAPATKRGPRRMRAIDAVDGNAEELAQEQIGAALEGGPIDRPSLERYVAANAECLSLVPDALREGVPERRDAEGLMGETAVAKLLFVRASLEADAGRGDAALDSLEIAREWTRGFEDTSPVGAMLTLFAEKTQASVVERTLATGMPSERACRALIAALESDSIHDRLVTALRLSRAHGFEKYRRLLSEGAGFGLTQRFAAGLRLNADLALDASILSSEVDYLRAMEARIAAARESTTKLIELVGRVRPRFVARGPLARVMCYEADMIAVALAEAEAHRAVTTVALELRAHELRFGQLPESLASLRVSARLRVDPFTQGSLGYRHEGAGFSVWSVGLDGKSDPDESHRRIDPRELTQDSSDDITLVVLPRS